VAESGIFVLYTFCLVVWPDTDLDCLNRDHVTDS